MSFELRAHTADVAVAATGATLGEVFAAVADGMAAAMCETVPATGGTRRDVAVVAESREALLFDYLDELIYERDVREVLPVDNEAAVAEPAERSPGAGDAPDPMAEPANWRLEGSYRGVPLDRVRARDLKAVTYSEMDLSEGAEGWEAYVVFDV